VTAKLSGKPEYPDVDDAPEVDIWPSPSNPMAVARKLIEVDGFRDAAGVLTIRWHRGAFLLWTGSRWVEIADRAMKTRNYNAVEHAQYWKETKDGMELVPWNANRHKIADVMEALSAIVHVDEQAEPPAWIEGDDSGSVLALTNGLLDLRSRTLLPHTPRLFNLLALPYEFVPAVSYPSRFLKFLDELFPHDQESIDLLQEWFGYILSGSTDQHKILLLVGPPRSGKGTIARVLTALVGKANTAGPTLASLGTNFGMSPLLGKAAAIVSDARLSGPNTFTVVERLLSISGEDFLTVDRKYREPWSGKLPTRFTVISNELPNLGDASGAMATRFLVLVLTRSWLGNENTSLTAELLEELPGILVWALDGLDRLQTEGRFIEPASSRDAVTALQDLASPVGAFVREACEMHPAYEVSRQTLYQAWRQWSRDHGRDHPTTDAIFGRDLRAAFPRIRDARPREDGKRVRKYEGIRLTQSYKDYMTDVHGPAWTGTVHDGPRTNSMYPLLWRCDGCGIERTDDMTGFACECDGHF
jgi:putative DNA primase/helicase